MAGLAATVADARSLRYDAVVARPRAAGPPGPRHAGLAAALAVAAKPRQGPFRIWLGAGVWREKLVVAAPDVWITGEDRSGTRIRFDAASGLAGPDGYPWGTGGSGTIIVKAPGFHAANLTIENSFDPAALGAEAPHDRQAVALMLAAGSDRTLLARVDILGRQDTLYVNAGRSIFRQCLVAGTVDFVFGAGQAHLSHCEVRSRGPGYIAAPSTNRSSPVGLVFDHCHLTHEPGVAAGSVYLARPWRPTRQFADGLYGDPDAVGMVNYLHCRMEAHIAPAAWTSMTYRDRAGERVALEPGVVRFAERGSTGPGARRQRAQDSWPG
ncbi:pectinesterase family protein [Sphingomonas crusticola]|uniref:pectinesterase family protein n=1 Tax=Sphingomonas crusticola TaxID=1697973 RepID=UPI0019670EDE|nr:pectinesterase family protein [Sphingomonas crusticola]